MIERLAAFIDSIGVSVRAFELNIKASNGLIRKAIAKNTDIQSKWLCAIAENYPQLDINWLLTGKGDMIRDNSTCNSESYPTPPLKDNLIYTLYKEKEAKIEELNAKLLQMSEEIGRLKRDNDFLIHQRGTNNLPVQDVEDVV